MEENPLALFLKENPVRKTALEAKVSTSTVTRLLDPRPANKKSEWLNRSNMAKWSQRRIRGFIKSVVKLSLYAELDAHEILLHYPLPYNSASLKKLIDSVVAEELTNLEKQFESSWHRIIETNEIRAAYHVNYPAYFSIDPKSGDYIGIFYELMEQIALSMDLQVQWVEQVEAYDMMAGLNEDRYDVVASPTFITSMRGKRVDFLHPLFYTPVHIYVRSDDDRFDDGHSLLNSREVRLVVEKGELSASIAATDFSDSTLLLFGEKSLQSNILQEVANGHADAAFLEPYLYEQWLDNGGEALKNITFKKPLRLMPTAMMIDKGEYRLQSMLNIAIEEQVNIGKLSELFQKYLSNEKESVLPNHLFRSDR